MINTTLIGLLLMIMNALGMNSINTEELEKELTWELEEKQKIQVAEENGIEILEPIEIYFMYGNENGTYWLDVNAEYENVIFVDYVSLEQWNIDYNSLHHGKMFIGLFAENGWELIDMITEDDLIKESEEANR